MTKQTIIKASAPRFKVILPLKIWLEHRCMSQYAKTEYSTLMEIEEVTDSVFRIVDWYMPYQDADWGGTNINRQGAIEFAKTQVHRFENMYGIFHIHPGKSKTYKPAMSVIDINAMWTWASNAKRGVFIVSNQSGNCSGIYVKKFEDMMVQFEMDVEIDFSVSPQRERELCVLLDERVTPAVYRRTAKEDNLEELPCIQDYEDYTDINCEDCEFTTYCFLRSDPRYA